MKCKKCKKEIAEGSKFCNWCGIKQQDDIKKRSDGRYMKAIVINGTRKYFYGKTKKELNQKIIQFNAEQEEKKAGIAFNIVADEWANSIKDELVFTTWKSYKARYERAKSHFADTNITEIKLKDINDYISLFPSSWAKKTVIGYISVINLIFAYAVKNEYIDTNPCLYAKTPKNLKSTQRRIVTQAERKIIEEYWDKCEGGLMMYFLLYSGLRRGEMLALTWGDIDFKNKEITVNKSVGFHGNQPYLKSTKTKSGTRQVILLDCLAEKLKPLRKNKDELLFGCENGYLTERRFATIHEHWVEATGLEDVTAHMLRHSFATYLFEAGVSVKDVQEIIGHSQYSTTMDIYTHITKEHREEALQKANKYKSKHK